MTTALIMAGGRSSRMRASLGRQHKALVKVLGVSMLERNLITLLSHNVREIFLAVSAAEKSLLAFARGRGQRIARAAGAELKVFIEKCPLGTIGAARAIRPASDDLLVVNVDNLTSLDLSAFVEHHRASKAALTVATHVEPFQVPFGQVSVKDGEIVDYSEKPILPVLLCSGTYVLSRAARLSIPLGKPLAAPDLVRMILRSNQRVSAFSHSSPWIDVNDAASVDRAEKLIMDNFESFELWREPPDREIATLCVLKPSKVALVKSQPNPASAIAQLPSQDVLSQQDTPVRSASRIRSQIGLPKVGEPRLLASFDELNTRNAQRTRHHIFVAHLVAKLAKNRNDALPPRSSTVSWSSVAGLVASHPHVQGSARTIAYLQRYVASQDTHSFCH